jgi:hypothetical protein
MLMGKPYQELYALAYEVLLQEILKDLGLSTLV